MFKVVQLNRFFSRILFRKSRFYSKSISRSNFQGLCEKSYRNKEFLPAEIFSQKSEHQGKKHNYSDSSVSLLLVKKILIKEKDYLFFAREMFSFLKAGLSLLEALNSVRERSSGRFRSFLLFVEQDLQRGMLLSQSLKKNALLFSSFFIELIKMGEVSGSLKDSFSYLSSFYQENIELKKAIKAALVYPFFVGIFSLLVFIALFFFVIPRFESVFLDFMRSEELPAITQFLFSAKDWIPLFFLFLCGLVWFFFFSVFLSKFSYKIRYFCGFLKSRIPIYRYYKEIQFAQFFSGLLSRGMKIDCALSGANKVLLNPFYQKSVNRILENLSEGVALSSSLKQIEFFSEELGTILSSAEKVGELHSKLEAYVRQNLKEYQLKVKNIISFIEPSLIICLAAIIGFVVFAFLLPMVSLIENIS